MILDLLLQQHEPTKYKYKNTWYIGDFNIFKPKHGIIKGYCEFIIICGIQLFVDFMNKM
jgi:hypothetical protein